MVNLSHEHDSGHTQLVIWIVTQNHSERYVRGSDGKQEGLRASEEVQSISQQGWY